MIQRALSRMNRTTSTERPEATSGVPTPWPATWDSRSTKHSASRAISEKTLSVSESSDKSERMSVLTDAYSPSSSLTALDAPRIKGTPLDLIRQPLDFKGPEAIAAIRRSAEEYRDAQFSLRTASLLSELARKKPGNYSKSIFSYEYASEWEDEMRLRKSEFNDRLMILENINEDVFKNQCRFNKQQAEVYACAVIKEFNLFCETTPIWSVHCPKKFEIFLGRIMSFINAIKCDIELEREINKTFKLAVVHNAWQFATKAQASGLTRDLDLYLSIHADWQRDAISL